MCMLFCAKKHVTFILNTNRKPTRIHCFGPFCVVHLVIVCVFAILTDMLADTQIYFDHSEVHAQSKILEANSQLYTVLLLSLGSCSL